ncbi:LicD family protein [Slackia piriformis]|uniref:LicD family protein n=1 Tax=Slackia piriformis TaxID=626934 RepID=UPI0023F1D93E|nr:LicD family protein [Slackia piriformis]
MTENKSYLYLKEMQQVSLETVLELDSFLKEHGIPYMLCGGTMLGAARHKGFIPWDDDIDLMMMRDDYDRLVALAPEIANMPNRRLVSAADGTFARDYARYVRMDYGKDEDDIAETDCPYLGLDIFPIDYIPDDQDLFLKQIKQRRPYLEMMVAYSSPFNAGSTFLKKQFRNVLRVAAKLYGPFNAARKSIGICSRYRNEPQRDIAIVCGMYGERERWPISECFPLVEVPFEGHMLPAPHGYVRYLSSIYGQNFMDLPPEDQRRPQHIRIWKL